MNESEKPVILVFTTAYKPFIGGAELAIQEIAMRLKAEYEFVIITARLKQTLKARERFLEGTVIRLGFGVPFLDKLLLPFLGFLEVQKNIKKNSKIMLWGVMISYASIGAYLVKCFHSTIPFALTIQEGNNEWKRFPSSWWWRIVSRRADHITAISNFLASRVRETGYKGSITIVPNGVNDRLLLINRESRLLSWRLNPSRVRVGSDADSDSKRLSQLVIFSASRLVHKNGIDILLDACAKIKDEFNFKVILAGDGEDRSALKIKSKKLGLEDRVEFLGNIPYDQLPQWYSKSDIFVRPSRSEGLGSAFLEAMAAGLITIGTPVGGISDFLEDGTTGFLVNPEDIGDLVRVLRRALQIQERERDGIIANARSLVRERFLWDHIARKMQFIFNSLL